MPEAFTMPPRSLHLLEVALFSPAAPRLSRIGVRNLNTTGWVQILDHIPNANIVDEAADHLTALGYTIVGQITSGEASYLVLTQPYT